METFTISRTEISVHENLRNFLNPSESCSLKSSFKKLAVVFIERLRPGGGGLQLKEAWIKARSEESRIEIEKQINKY